MVANGACEAFYRIGKKPKMFFHHVGNLLFNHVLPFNSKEIRIKLNDFACLSINNSIKPDTFIELVIANDTKTCGFTRPLINNSINLDAFIELVIANDTKPCGFTHPLIDNSIKLDAFIESAIANDTKIYGFTHPLINNSIKLDGFIAAANEHNTKQVALAQPYKKTLQKWLLL